MLQLSMYEHCCYRNFRYSIWQTGSAIVDCFLFFAEFGRALKRFNTKMRPCLEKTHNLVNGISNANRLDFDTVKGLCALNAVVLIKGISTSPFKRTSYCIVRLCCGRARSKKENCCTFLWEHLSSWFHSFQYFVDSGSRSNILSKQKSQG